MSIFGKLGITLVLLLSSAWVLAGSDSGFYLGGAIGSASNDVAFDELEYSDDDTGYKVFAGYNFGLVPTIDLAVEGSYVDFGDSSVDIIDENVSTQTTAWDVFGVAGFNLGPVGVFGKLGMVAWDNEVSLSTAADTFTEDGSDPAYGIGAKIQLQSFSIRAEYEYFDLEYTTIDFISIGASYTF